MVEVLESLYVCVRVQNLRRTPVYVTSHVMDRTVLKRRQDSGIRIRVLVLCAIRNRVPASRKHSWIVSIADPAPPAPVRTVKRSPVSVGISAWTVIKISALSANRRVVPASRKHSWIVNIVDPAPLAPMRTVKWSPASVGINVGKVIRILELYVNLVTVLVLRRRYSTGITVVVVIEPTRVSLTNPTNAVIKRRLPVCVGTDALNSKMRMELTTPISALFATPKVDRVLRCPCGIVKFVDPVRSSLPYARRMRRRSGRQSHQHCVTRVNRRSPTRRHPAPCPMRNSSEWVKS